MRKKSLVIAANLLFGVLLMVSPFLQLPKVPAQDDQRGWEYYDAKLRTLIDTIDNLSEGNINVLLRKEARDQYFRGMPSDGMNLLPNGSFENDGDFWYLVTTGGNTITIKTDATKARTGNKYCEINADPDNYGQIMPGIEDSSALRLLEVSPGEVYEFVGNIYLESVGVGGAGYVAAGVRDKDLNILTFSAGDGNLITTTGSYQESSAIFTIPADAKWMDLHVVAAINGTVARVDDVTLIKVSDGYYRIPVEMEQMTELTAPDGAADLLEIWDDDAGAYKYIKAGRLMSYKSIQPFSITISGANTSATATINSVDVANNKAFIVPNGFTLSLDNGLLVPDLVLTNATTVTASRVGGISGTTVVRGVVLETY